MALSTYYIPIEPGSLAHYFGRAIIAPSIYFSNKPADFQDSYQTSLMLSKKKWLYKNSCAIEIVVNRDEEHGLQTVNDDIFLSSLVFPISRVKAIYFTSKEVLETTLWNTNNGTAYIPKAIAYVEDRDGDIQVPEIEPSILSKEDIPGIHAKLKLFDQYLGGIAFMKVAANRFQDYSDNYFSTLSFFSNRINDEVKKIPDSIRQAMTFKYQSFLTRNDSDVVKYLKYIYTKPITVEDLLVIAKEEKRFVNLKFGIPQLNLLPKDAFIYDLAVLATYGDKRAKSIEDFTSDLSNKEILSQAKGDELALLMGIAHGYFKLRNQYKVKGLVRKVKFELNSQLDYYTIESIFQYVFNGNRSDIDDAYIPLLVNERSIEPNGLFRVLDETIFAAKKEEPQPPKGMSDTNTKKGVTELYNLFAQFLKKRLSFINDKDFLTSLEGEIGKAAVDIFSKTIAEEVDKANKSAFIKLSSEILTLKVEIRRLNNELARVRGAASFNKPIVTDVSDSSEVSEIIQEEMNLEMLSVPALRQLAKQKNIQNIPKRKEDIIKLIKQTKNIF